MTNQNKIFIKCRSTQMILNNSEFVGHDGRNNWCNKAILGFKTKKEALTMAMLTPHNGDRVVYVQNEEEIEIDVEETANALGYDFFSYEAI